MGPLSSPLPESSGQPRGPLTALLLLFLRFLLSLSHSSSTLSSLLHSSLFLLLLPPLLWPVLLSLPVSSSSVLLLPVRRFFLRPLSILLYPRVRARLPNLLNPRTRPGPKEIIVIYRRLFRIVGYFAVVVPSRVGIRYSGLGGTGRQLLCISSHDEEEDDDDDDDDDDRRGG